MPFIVRIGNRQGGPPSINVSEKPKVVSIECCCRSLPKFIELVMVIVCGAFTGSSCNPIIRHTKGYNTSDAVSNEYDETRSYLAFVSIFICMFVIFGLCCGYCIEGVKKMIKHETMLLVLCGGLCVVSGGLVLDAIVNHSHKIRSCSKEQKPLGLTGGSLFIILGMVFFLDGFIAHKMQPTISPTPIATQQSVKTKHLPAQSSDVVYVSSKEKYKMDFAEDTE